MKSIRKNKMMTVTRIDLLSFLFMVSLLSLSVLLTSPTPNCFDMNIHECIYTHIPYVSALFAGTICVATLAYAL